MTPAAPAAGADAPDWIVLKFGGTSVSRRHRWDTIGRLMKRRAEEEGARVLVVVSALSGVTNELQAICDGHADAARRQWRRIGQGVHGNVSSGPACRGPHGPKGWHPRSLAGVWMPWKPGWGSS